MTIDSIVAFIVTSSLVSLAPGPDNIYVLTQSALYGRKSGVFVTLGLCTGLVVHTAAVSFGLAAIFKSSEFAFNVLKYLGATYLVYLAWKAFKSTPSSLPFEEREQVSLSHCIYVALS